MTSSEEVVSLYCFVNVLSLMTAYDWHTPSSFVLPSSPVVYVFQPGIYFCTVTHDGNEVTSHTIEVVLVPGTSSK